MRIRLTVLIMGLLIGGNALVTTSGEMKDGYYLTAVEGEFSDVVADLNDAIINRGLVVDFVGHVGEMLARTGDAVAMESPFANADYLHFCSAKTTHTAVAANPENIAICPYVVFAYALKSEPGNVRLGFRRPRGADGAENEAALQAIENLLQEIVDEAVE